MAVLAPQDAMLAAGVLANPVPPLTIASQRLKLGQSACETCWLDPWFPHAQYTVRMNVVLTDASARALDGKRHNVELYGFSKTTKGSGQMCSHYRLGTELGQCRTSDEKVHVTGAQTGQHKIDIVVVSQRRPSLRKKSARLSEPNQIHMSRFQQPKYVALLLWLHEVKLWTVQNVPWVNDMQT